MEEKFNNIGCASKLHANVQKIFSLSFFLIEFLCCEDVHVHINFFKQTINKRKGNFFIFFDEDRNGMFF